MIPITKQKTGKISKKYFSLKNKELKNAKVGFKIKSSQKKTGSVLF